MIFVNFNLTFFFKRTSTKEPQKLSEILNECKNFTNATTVGGVPTQR